MRNTPTGPGRLLHVITDLKVGGAETMLLKLLAATDRHLFAPQVVSLLPGGELAAPIRDLGVPVHELGAGRGRLPVVAAWRLTRLARRLRPTLVQGWMYHGNLAAALAAAAAPGPVRQFWNVRQTLADLGREPPLTRAVIRLGSRLSGRPEAVVYNAAISRDQHVALGYRAGNARLLPNGFDLDRFGPDPTAGAALRAELGLPATAPLVGMLARRHPFKGHELFLRAMAAVRQRLPAAHAVCAGRGVVGDDTALAALAGRDDLRGHVHLLGPRGDAPRFLAGLDVLCVASRWGEGFPNVLGEALACGTPCVATDVGESRTILAGVGDVVQPDDPGALAAALVAVLELEAAARADLARQCRARVAERYSLAAVARRYEELWSGGGASA